VLRIEPGKEDEFRYLEGWLASSDWLDRLLEATTPGRPAQPSGAREQWPVALHAQVRRDWLLQRHLARDVRRRSTVGRLGEPVLRRVAVPLFARLRRIERRGDVTDPQL
jgi:hypothetical protein